MDLPPTMEEIEQMECGFEEEEKIGLEMAINKLDKENISS